MTQSVLVTTQRTERIGVSFFSSELRKVEPVHRDGSRPIFELRTRGKSLRLLSD